IEEIVLNAPTPLPSFTPVPPCQEFVVRVPIAIVRAGPSTSSRIIEGLREGETVCVITMLPDSEWYLIDQNMLTRRLERVYMHRDIIRALNPTPRPTATAIPSDTATPTDTATPVNTSVPLLAPSEVRLPATSWPLRPSPTAMAPSISL
ncbi:MAG: SH3 domain-containing protein, partial [Chloroflexi bacterium]|nr:SH3 domain-containing protein [Chloroflexota bacterium]